MSNDATLPLAEQEFIHYVALQHTLNPFSNVPTFATNLARCTDFAARKVAVASTFVMDPRTILKSLMGSQWRVERVAEINSLFHAYVAAGLVDVDQDMAHPFAFGTHAPLELAVRSDRNIDAMVALIECGADETKVPKEAFRLQDDGPVRAAPGDFLEFARTQVQNGSQYFAAAKAAIMRRVITESTSQKEFAEPAPAVPRRKGPIV